MRERIGAYRIVRQLGCGGMGVVYEAIHEQLERRVALKTLHPQLCSQPAVATRFLNEARAVNIVRHPSLVDVYEFGSLDDGTLYIVIEYLEGETLSARAQHAGLLNVDELLRIARQLAAALAAAHAKGVVHRDLKPDNVMLVEDPEVEGGTRAKLLDFGIAKLLGASSQTPANHLTNTGLIIGTPLYMAPEQCRGGGDVDGKVDVYALGIMLYELLVGAPPFSAASSWELMGQHLNDAPPPLPSSVLPDLARLVDRMLAKLRELRPTMGEVVAVLTELRAGSITSRATIKAEAPSPARARAGTWPPRATTLGAAAGERSGAVSPSRRVGPSVMAAVAALTLVGGLLLSWGDYRSSRNVVAPASVNVSPAPSPPAPPAPAPAPPTVTWAVESTPAGASVERLDTRERVGVTPWRSRQPPRPGVTRLRLKLPGYRPREVALDEAHDELRQIQLTPLRRDRRVSNREDDDEVQTVH